MRVALGSGERAGDAQGAARLVPVGPPGRLTLQGLPAGARVTLNGMPFRGSQQDVPPGTHTLAVRAGGFAPYDRLVVVLPGAPSTVRLDLQPLTVSREDGKAGPCDQYGPAYNQDHLCFDTRPVPLSSTRIPRSEEHTSELQSRPHLVCRLLLEKKKT